VCFIVLHSSQHHIEIGRCDLDQPVSCQGKNIDNGFRLTHGTLAAVGTTLCHARIVHVVRVDVIAGGWITSGVVIEQS
jgi:hypothetical protein